MSEKNQEKTNQDKIIYKPGRKHRKLLLGNVIFSVINYSVFAIFALMCIFPFYYLFINTISDNSLVQKGVITWFPQGMHIQNYIAMMNVSDLGRAFAVTILRTVIGTALMVVSTAFVGYLMTKDEMWGRKFWYRFLMITMYFNAGIIPWYLTMSTLGLTNNFLGYIIPGIVAPYNIILVKTYIESIPGELEESALIDGAGFFTIFRKIIWPLSKPILATIAIFGAVGHWNSYIDSIILMQSSPELKTVQHRLYEYLTQTTNLEAVTSLGGQMASRAAQNAMNSKVLKYTISMVTVIPILVVYPFMNRYFEKGIMLGAVKG
jgi:multiple sugar transport system permease protein/putative aldouronate transport system permease protein